MKHVSETGMADHSGALVVALDELAEAARELGAAVSRRDRERLRKWAELVIAWRRRAGLTAVATPEAVVRDLMVPALYALPALASRGAAHVVDLGCGNGCTGAALAVVAEAGRFYLIDRSEKKVTFCRYAASRCGMPRIEAHTRAKALDEGLRGDAVLARSLPRTPGVPGEIGAFARPGAIVVRWLGTVPKGWEEKSLRCGDRELWVVVDSVGGFT